MHAAHARGDCAPNTHLHTRACSMARARLLAVALLAVAVTDARQLVTLGEFAKVALLTPTTTRAAALSIACPLFCSAAGLVGKDFDPALLSLIIAVPSSISINAAYVRRERALTCLAKFRSSTYALHHSVQRWGQPDDRSSIQRENAALFESLCLGLESGGDPVMFRDVFKHLEAIGEVVESVRQSPRREQDVEFMPALCTLLLSDERVLWQTIDELRMLSSTATPYLLRGFTVGGATLFPIIFGPYFAEVAVTSGRTLDSYSAYFVSFLLAVTIGSLVSIQEALEDPFDGSAPLDDISLPPFAPPGFSLWRSDMPIENRDLVAPP